MVVVLQAAKMKKCLTGKMCVLGSGPSDSAQD